MSIQPYQSAALADSDSLNTIGKQILDLYFPTGERPPLPVAKAAAFIALTLGLSPAQGEIYIASFGSKKTAEGQWEKDWRAIVGVKGYRKKAREISNYTLELRVMDAEEVKAQRGNLYTENDVGIECTLWRFDVAKEARSIGIPYHPTKGFGFWREKARYKNNSYEPDNIPESWTRQMVAEKRAELNALKVAYDLGIPTRTMGDVPVDVGDPGAEGDIIEGTARIVEKYGVEAMDWDDDLKRRAIASSDQEDANIKADAERTPEERQAVGRQAKADLTGKKKQRLGDEPAAPAETFDPVAWAMPFGVFADEEKAGQAYALIVSKANERGEDAQAAWESYVSKLVDKNAAQEEA